MKSYEEDDPNLSHLPCLPPCCPELGAVEPSLSIPLRHNLERGAGVLFNLSFVMPKFCAKFSSSIADRMAQCFP